MIRIFEQGTPRPIRVAEVHTLGTGSWECVGSSPFSSASFSRYKAEFTTYMTGVLYWFYRELSSFYIDSFDIDNGRFQSVPPPPFELRTSNHRVSIGILGDSLCLCEVAFLEDINVWVRKNNAGENSWTKEFSISSLRHESQWPFGLYQPMKYLKNGGLLMFHSSSNSFMYYHPRDQAYKYLKLCGPQSNCEAFIHVPSFISLKGILTGNETEVLNINSRCAGYRLHGEARALSLEEEEIQICFPKEVNDEITSVVVSTRNRMQC